MEILATCSCDLPGAADFVAGAFVSCLVSADALLWGWSVMCFGFPQM